MANVQTAAQIRAFLPYKAAAVTDACNGPIEYAQDRYESVSDGMALSINGSLSTTVTSVKASAGKVYLVIVESGTAILGTTTTASNAAYVQIFNVASGSVTLGTTSPDMVIKCPANEAVAISVESGGSANIFGTAISVAAATTGKGNTALATADLPNVTIKYA